MAANRYTNAPRLNTGAMIGTSRTTENIRTAIKSGALPTTTMIVKGAERLDTIAGVVYGDSRYWWILAAASDIGWCLQVPVGTVLNVPDLPKALALIG